MKPGVLSIGTTDPWNAAGLGLDERVFADIGVRCYAVVAAVSAQDRGGVRSLVAIPAESIVAQIESLAEAEIGAVRVGALSGVAAVEAIARATASLAAPRVLDPVVSASAGGTFAGPDTLAAIARALVPGAALVTPNVAEAAALTGLPVATADEMVAAGARLVAMGARAALVTGGHLGGDPTDVLVMPGAPPRVFSAPRLAEMRGTGCVLAAAAAAALARGRSIPDAVVDARAYVRERIARSNVSGGMRTAF